MLPTRSILQPSSSDREIGVDTFRACAVAERSLTVWSASRAGVTSPEPESYISAN
jgi:hypothetical protein